MTVMVQNGHVVDMLNVNWRVLSVALTPMSISILAMMGLICAASVAAVESTLASSASRASTNQPQELEYVSNVKQESTQQTERQLVRTAHHIPILIRHRQDALVQQAPLHLINCEIS